MFKAWEFCKGKNSHCIEVVYKDEEDQEEIISKVYFNVDLKVTVTLAVTLEHNDTSHCML